MDKFEQVMKQMAGLSKKDMEKTVEAKKKACICGGCPTYTSCAREKKEFLFCVLGKSPTCITEEIECICPQCPLTEELGLTNEFFCTKGSEREQRGT